MPLPKKYWESGEYNFNRINWKNVKEAKLELRDVFNKKGIYIWGVDENPLYIGKTKQSFAERFSRYVGGNKAQFSLAETYWKELEQGGRKKEYEEIMTEYGIGKSRAIGVKAFGEGDSNKVWFILIPFTEDTEELISGLEEALIMVGRRWNNEKGYNKTLINID